MKIQQFQEIISHYFDTSLGNTNKYGTFIFESGERCSRLHACVYIYIYGRCLCP